MHLRPNEQTRRQLVSVHMMIHNRPVDPGAIKGSHRPTQPPRDRTKYYNNCMYELYDYTQLSLLSKMRVFSSLKNGSHSCGVFAKMYWYARAATSPAAKEMGMQHAAYTLQGDTTEAMRQSFKTYHLQSRTAAVYVRVFQYQIHICP